jgi:Trk-type K+ transport system membrane component
MIPRRPGSATGAMWLVAGMIVLTGVTALLTAVFEDDLVGAWAQGRTDLGSVQPPAFVPVAITMFVVVALLALVLLEMFRHGHDWARILLTALVLMMTLATVAGLRTGPPAFFLVLSLVSLVVDLAALALLWHPDTRAFTSGRRAA